MQRGLVAHGAVAALVQADAGAVEEDLAQVLHDGKAQLVGLAGLGQPRQAVVRAEMVDGGLFDDGLAVRHGVQLRIKAVALDGERALARDEALERNGLHALIQLLKRPRREARQQDHDPLAHAQPDIRARQLGRAAREKHAAILDAHILHVHSPQLVAHEALKAKQARHGHCPTFHCVSSRPNSSDFSSLFLCSIITDSRTDCNGQYSPLPGAEKIEKT